MGGVGGRVPGVCAPAATLHAHQDVAPQACTLLLLVLFVYDVFFVFITPFLTKVGAPARALLPRPRPRAPPL